LPSSVEKTLGQGLRSLHAQGVDLIQGWRSRRGSERPLEKDEGLSAEASPMGFGPSLEFFVQFVGYVSYEHSRHLGVLV
jgi:hypothetical protein